jgi:hypothetical protein
LQLDSMIISCWPLLRASGGMIYSTYKLSIDKHRIRTTYPTVPAVTTRDT